MSTLTITLAKRGFFAGPCGTEGWVAISDNDSTGCLANGDTLRGDFSGPGIREVYNVTQARTVNICMERWHDTQASMLAFLRSLD